MLEVDECEVLDLSHKQQLHKRVRTRIRSSLQHGFEDVDGFVRVTWSKETTRESPYFRKKFEKTLRARRKGRDRARTRQWGSRWELYA
ncbi:MAG: hypothetical protein ACTSU5_11630 [Promethearchaeota archaeon]